MLHLTSLLKEAGHAHDRIEERLNLPRESVDLIQSIADKMWYSHGRKKLSGEFYYTPLRDPQRNTVGYAAFRKVGNPGKNRLILTTILSREMKPKGDNIGSFFNEAVKGVTPVNPNEPKVYKGMPPIPDATKS